MQPQAAPRGHWNWSWPEAGYFSKSASSSAQVRSLGSERGEWGIARNACTHPAELRPDPSSDQTPPRVPPRLHLWIWGHRGAATSGTVTDQMSARKEMNTSRSLPRCGEGEMETHALKITSGSSVCISWSAENELISTVTLLSLSRRPESSCKHLSCSEVVSHALQKAGFLSVTWEILPFPCLGGAASFHLSYMWLYAIARPRGKKKK